MDVDTNSQSPVKTVLTLTVASIVFYFVFEEKWLLITAVSIGGIGLVSTYLTRKIHFFWMKLAWVLSLIVPNILLSLLFFLFLTPIAVIYRLSGGKNRLNLVSNSITLFKNSNKRFSKSSFEKPW